MLLRGETIQSRTGKWKENLDMWFIYLATINRTPAKVAKMAEQEDPERTSSHSHTKITTIYAATIDEKDLKTSREDLLQLKV